MPPRRLTAAALAALLMVGQGSTAVAPVSAARSTPTTTSSTTTSAATAPPRSGPPISLDASGLPPPNGKTSLVSKNLAGTFPSGPSVEASISESGRFVAFSSLAANLVPNDTNDAQDVFVVDRRTGHTTRLPLPGGGAVPAGGRAFDPSISADGGTVAFTYQAPPLLLVVGTIVLVWDRSTGKTTIVSRRADKTVAQNSREASVSGNGKRIAYTSDANVIDAIDSNDRADVFVLDRSTGKTTLVSISVDNGGGSGPSGRPSISADGKLVAFDSTAADLVSGGGLPPAAQVYVRDLAPKTTQLVSVSGAGGYGNGLSQAPSTSADGHAIAFESAATNLTPGDTGGSDVFVRDRTVGTTTLVSVNLTGGSGNGASGQASIAADGRIVAFTTQANDLVAAADAPIVLAAVTLASEVLARDLVLGDTIRISEAAAGGPGGGQSFGPSVGGDGRYVAFASSSPVLVKGDDNKLADVFLRDLPPDPLVNPPVLNFGALAVGQPGLPLAAIVSNRGWGPLIAAASTRSGPAAADFSVLADGCKGRPLHRTESCTLSVGFTATDKGSRTATLRIPGNFNGSPRTVRLVGVGSKAVLKLVPDIGNPGIVTIVSGSGFPAGATVVLSWSVGITPKLAKIVTDADGKFRIGVLIFHHDVIGPRDLIAARVAGPLFPPAQAPMLVTSAPDVPSTYNWQLEPPFGPPLIFRR
jgi:Tol biopolymer transport system component